MPTPLPRVNVTVTEEQHALLLEMAKLDRGRSAAGFLRELLDQVTPLLRDTVALMRTATQEQDKARQGLAGMLAELNAKLEQGDLLDAPADAAPRTAATAGARTRRSARTGHRKS